MRDKSPHEQGLYRVMVLGTAVSFGVLGAIAVSMRDFLHGDARFHFSFWSVVGFAAGAFAGWLLWKLVPRR